MEEKESRQKFLKNKLNKWVIFSLKKEKNKYYDESPNDFDIVRFGGNVTEVDNDKVVLSDNNMRRHTIRLEDIRSIDR